MAKQLLPLLFASLLVPAVVAQTGSSVPSPVGAYHVVKSDGSPPVAGATVSLLVVPTPLPGVYYGIVSIDKGSGAQVVPRETMTIAGFGTPLPWANAAGNQGRLDWNGTEWGSTVLTGPHAGEVRRLLPE